MGALESLIYVSHAVHPLRPQEVAGILERSAGLNKRDGVHGFLLYSEQRFMQCLEGSAHGVREAYQRIVRATTHHGILEIFNGALEHRRFAEWEWAYRSDQQLQFSSAATEQFLTQSRCSGSGSGGFIEQTILQAFWVDPVGANHLWGSDAGQAHR